MVFGQPVDDPVGARAFVRLRIARARLVRFFAAVTAGLGTALVVSDVALFSGGVGDRQLPFLYAHAALLAASAITAIALHGRVRRAERSGTLVPGTDAVVAAFVGLVLAYGVVATALDTAFHGSEAGYVIAIVAVGRVVRARTAPIVSAFGLALAAYLAVVFVRADPVHHASMTINGVVATVLASLTAIAGYRFGETRYRAEVELEDANDRARRLLVEANHRIKNNFATIEAFLVLGLEERDPAERTGLVEDTLSRVRAARTLYDRLLASPDARGVRADAYLDALVEETSAIFVVRDRVTIDTKIDPLILAPDAMLPLGIITVELVTNSMKYAFGPNGGGRLTVTLAAPAGGETILQVADDGPGLADEDHLTGGGSFGMTLIREYARQLGGGASYAHDGGARFSIHVDRARIEAAAVHVPA